MFNSIVFYFGFNTRCLLYALAEIAVSITLLGVNNAETVTD